MDYVHRIEYRRRDPAGRLVLEHTETADDHGWYIRKEADWKSYYTRECALEFLARVKAVAGTYTVAVWRGRTRFCTVGLECAPQRGEEVRSRELRSLL